jgi:hypothetical protein
VPAIFISYRRSDEQNFAGRLHERLTGIFGEHRVFIDVVSIELGADFKVAFEHTLSRCRVVLVVIGKRWFGSRNAYGRRKLHEPTDYVRLEIESALSRPDIRLIPVLVEGASMPREANLPQSMAPLARLRAHEMSHVGFKVESEVLISAIRRIIEPPFPPAPHVAEFDDFV